MATFNMNKMNTRGTESLRLRADIFKALGHPTRLWIVEFLSEGPRSVAEIAEEVEGGLSAISQHLAMLRQYGVILDERRGRQIYYSIAAPCALAACSALNGITADNVTVQPKLRRSNATTYSVLSAILILSCSASALLWALNPYFSRRPPQPPPPAFDHTRFANRLEKHYAERTESRFCTCGLPINHKRDESKRELQAQKEVLPQSPQPLVDSTARP